MMVTFISECEKKALTRTRRVLDAFANRIGSRTWQTVITEEGLQAVKKLLRKSATKNTAVACHWIRSRSRSELQWIVGNQDKFNGQGIVPVNYTNNQIIIGEIEIMVNEIYANTKKQRLDQHLFAVGYLAYCLIKKLTPEQDQLAINVFIAGCWHDLGKIDPAFQNWLLKLLNKKNYEDVPDDGQHIDKKTGKFSWQRHPRHNEISLLLFHLFFKNTDINHESIEQIKHAIYWHHAKPLRDKKNEIKRLVGIFNKLEDFEQIFKHFSASLTGIIKSVKTIADEYDEELGIAVNDINLLEFEDIENNIESVELPEYKRYSRKESLEKYQNNIKHNALNNLARSSLITADRLVSKLSAEALEEHINNQSLMEILDAGLIKERGVKQHIQICLDGFKQNNPEIQRNQHQAIAAEELADEAIDIGVLRGAAGCGKTKIALEWALNTNVKKMYWICPRVQICEGLFNDLQSPEYLPNAKVEICTGEIKLQLKNGLATTTPEGEEFSGDVVITTIDQIINSITTHRNIETLISFMDSHVVFDEYHEYINMPGFNLLFAELVECKKYQQKDEETTPNTLLVSATPNPLFVEEFLHLKKGMVGIKSFNETPYRIRFIEYNETKEDESNPLFQAQSADQKTIVISNTALTAQKSFIDHQQTENGLLLHAKFIKSHRERLFKKAMESFGKNGNRSIDVLRSGPVVQAALNITSEKMIADMTHAENFLQRLGRLGRFGENDQVNEYIIALTAAVRDGKSKDRSSRFLNSLKSLQSARAWYEFLQNELPDGEVLINQVYQLYEQFYQDQRYQDLVRQDLIAALKDGVERLDFKLFDPVTVPNSKKETTNIKIKKHSLRGDSCFVQMAVVNILSRGAGIEHQNKYLDEEMTYEINQLEGDLNGQRQPEKDLISYMYQKHHKILSVKEGENIKQVHSINVLKNEARDPQTPLYISYTQDDLSLCHDSENPYAIYYAEGNQQPIGAISLKQLTNEGE